jgi:ferredoxin
MIAEQNFRNIKNSTERVMRVLVDNDICSGCGLCASLCPDAFDMGADGKASPRHKTIPTWFEQEYQNAADTCPEGAIKIFCQV